MVVCVCRDLDFLLCIAVELRDLVIKSVAKLFLVVLYVPIFSEDTHGCGLSSRQFLEYSKGQRATIVAPVLLLAYLRGNVHWSVWVRKDPHFLLILLCQLLGFEEEDHHLSLPISESVFPPRFS